VLYAIWDKYGCEEDEPPVPTEKPEESSIVKEFINLFKMP